MSSIMAQAVTLRVGGKIGFDVGAFARFLILIQNSSAPLR